MIRNSSEVESMPRHKKCRRVCVKPNIKEFIPVIKAEAKSCLTIVMSIDEFETIRLIDYDGLTQEECARQMNVARTTITGIYEEARRKIADALVNGKRLIIEGGDYTLCEKYENCCGKCGRDYTGCMGCQKKCMKNRNE